MGRPIVVDSVDKKKCRFFCPVFFEWLTHGAQSQAWDTPPGRSLIQLVQP